MDRALPSKQDVTLSQGAQGICCQIQSLQEKGPARGEASPYTFKVLLNSAPVIGLAALMLSGQSRYVPNMLDTHPQDSFLRTKGAYGQFSPKLFYRESWEAHALHLRLGMKSLAFTPPNHC